MTSEIRRGRRFPFVILPHGVLDDETLTAHDVLVYATIARYADNHTGVAYPSRATIAKAARCDIKTVDSAVRKLVLSGCLEKHKRTTDTGEANVYIVHEQTAQGSRGRGTNGAGVGEQTVRGGGKQTVRELDPIELEAADPSEWTGMPDEIREMLKFRDTGGTP
jgi:hypothetical protein